MVVSEAIFEPLAARQELRATHAGVRKAFHDTGLGAGELSLDL
ncbi:hypothetical protein BH23PLA1_BH23PLA1_30210 [soil metagenome]